MSLRLWCAAVMLLTAPVQSGAQTLPERLTGGSLPDWFLNVPQEPGAFFSARTGLTAHEVLADALGDLAQQAGLRASRNRRAVERGTSPSLVGSDVVLAARATIGPCRVESRQSRAMDDSQDSALLGDFSSLELLDCRLGPQGARIVHDVKEKGRGEDAEIVRKLEVSGLGYDIFGLIALLEQFGLSFRWAASSSEQEPLRHFLLVRAPMSAVSVEPPVP